MSTGAPGSLWNFSDETSGSRNFLVRDPGCTDPQMLLSPCFLDIIGKPQYFYANQRTVYSRCKKLDVWICVSYIWDTQKLVISALRGRKMTFTFLKFCLKKAFDIYWKRNSMGSLESMKASHLGDISFIENLFWFNPKLQKKKNEVFLP